MTDEFITRAEAEKVWSQEIADRRWWGKAIEEVMFALPDLSSTSYTGCWRTVAGDRDQARRSEVEEVMRDLLRQGEQRSSLWRGQNAGRVALVPLPVDEQEVLDAIANALPPASEANDRLVVRYAEGGGNLVEAQQALIRAVNVALAWDH